MENFKSERLIDALIKSDQYQHDQTRLQMRTAAHPNFRKGDVTTNGPAPVHSAVGAATRKSKWSWI